MVGITCAYLLKKEGVKVAVIEADRIVKVPQDTQRQRLLQHSLTYRIKRLWRKEQDNMLMRTRRLLIL